MSATYVILGALALLAVVLTAIRLMKRLKVKRREKRLSLDFEKMKANERI
jgi:hypothetical protein